MDFSNVFLFGFKFFKTKVIMLIIDFDISMDSINGFCVNCRSRLYPEGRFEYSKDIYQDLTKLRNEIKSSKDLKKFSKQIKSIEKKITLFHGIAVNKILKKTKVKVDFIGFHGQTIFHSYIEKISMQLGDGKLLSALTKKKVIYDFRQNDLKNNGLGAPLTPIFHKLLCRKFKIKEQTSILGQACV